MPLIEVVIVLIVVGVVLWLINTYIPMAAAVKSHYAPSRRFVTAQRGRT
jgi:hypothetical protein